MGKQCRQCKEVKEADQFHKDKSQEDGIKIYCKACMVGRNASRDKEKSLAASRAWEKKQKVGEVRETPDEVDKVIQEMVEGLTLYMKSIGKHELGKRKTK